MRDKVKRFLSILMTALMLVNLLPVGALADGIVSGGYQQQVADTPKGAWVYIYARLDEEVPGTELNKDQWYTLGKAYVENMPVPTEDDKGILHDYGDISGVSVGAVIGGMQRYHKNTNIPASAYISSAGGNDDFGFKVCPGASDYDENGTDPTWHLNLKINAASVQCTYTFYFWSGQKEIKEPVVVKGHWNQTGEYTPPQTINYGGYVYELNNDYYSPQPYKYTFDRVHKTYTFYYTETSKPAPFKLKIYYYYGSVQDANRISPDDLGVGKENPYTEDVMQGDPYSVTSPTIIGYKPDTDVVSGTMEDHDLTVNVVYTWQNKLRYKVKHLDMDGKSIGVGQESFTNAKYGETIKSSDKQRQIEGYTFDHAVPESIQILDNNQEINLYYKKNTYTIKYLKGDENKASDDFTEREYTAKHGDPTPIFVGNKDGQPGWVFAGWNPLVLPTVTGDAEYKALWKEKDVTVTYKAEYGGTTEPLSTQKITAFSADKLKDETAPNKERDGYTFIGWFKDDAQTPFTTEKELSKATAAANLNKDGNNLFIATTFTAKYVPMTVDVKYIVEKDGVKDEANPISTQTISVITGEPLAAVTAVPIKGYRFDGWYRHTEQITNDSTSTLEKETAKRWLYKIEPLYAPTTFTAKYTSLLTEVHYKAEAHGVLDPEDLKSDYVRVATGDIIRNNAVQDDDFVLVTAVPKAGYVFDAWLRINNGGKPTELEGVGAALTVRDAKANLNKKDDLYTNTEYHATFKPNTETTAKVTYKVADGQGDYGYVEPDGNQIILQATGNLADGTPISGSKAMAYPGYKFVGWYKGEEQITDENTPTLTPEWAEEKLTRNEQGLYQDTIFEARFELDAGQQAEVIYQTENGTILNTSGSTSISQFVQIVTGEGLTDVTVDPNPGYKLEGWYVVDNEGNETPISGLNPAETLNAGKAKDNLNKDKEDNKLYAATTFIARCVLDEDQHATVIYTIDETQRGYGSVDPSIIQIILQATGKLASGDPISGSTAMANPGYKFVGWYKATGEMTSTGEMKYELVYGEPELTSKLAEQNLTQNEQGLYQNTVFAAKFEPIDYHYTVKHYWIGDKDNQDAQPFHTDDGENQTAPYGSTVKYREDGGTSWVIETNPVYTFAEQTNPEDGQITIGTEESQNVLKLYYYKNVKLTANSDMKTYDGNEHLVTDYTCAVAEMKDGNVVYVPQQPGETPLKFEGVKASSPAGIKDVGEYDVKFHEDPVEENNGLYYVNASQTGMLTITPALITLQAPIQSKPYDGKPLKAKDYIYGYNGPKDLDKDLKSVSVEGSQTLVGSSESRISGHELTEGKKKENYDIRYLDGKLTVTDGTGDNPVDPKNVVTKNHGPEIDTDAAQYPYNLGETVRFKIAVTNIYNEQKEVTLEELPGVAFETQQGVTYDGTKATKTLAPGDTWTIYATYTITSADILAGFFHNTVTADFTDGGSWTAEDEVKTHAPYVELDVTKTSDVKDGERAALGQTITYTIEVKYQSNVAGKTVYVQDPLTGLETSFTTEEALEEGKTVTFTTTYTVTEQDVKDGSVTNTAMVKSELDNEWTPASVETPTFAPITIKPKDVWALYNGAAITGKDVEIVSGKLLEGHRLSATVVGSGVNAGTYPLTLDPETLRIVDEHNKDVSEMYARSTKLGVLTIAKRTVVITSQSAAKTYDGKALTRPAVTITGDGFVPGELAKAEATGSITKVGSTPNTIRYTTAGAFNAANYNIMLSVGTLTVNEKPAPEPRRTFNLTINYVYQNGKRAAASYNRGGLKNGETFDITSPVIAGYTASETVVSGTIYNRDIKVTVIYTADKVNLDDYGVPLGLGNITMNVGDCFE